MCARAQPCHTGFPSLSQLHKFKLTLQASVAAAVAISQASKSSSAVTSSSINPRDRLKRKMQILLNKQCKKFFSAFTLPELTFCIYIPFLLQIKPINSPKSKRPNVRYNSSKNAKMKCVNLHCGFVAGRKIEILIGLSILIRIFVLDNVNCGTSMAHRRIAPRMVRTRAPTKKKTLLR